MLRWSRYQSQAHGSQFRRAHDFALGAKLKMTEARQVLALEQAVLQSGPPGGGDVIVVDIALHPGELVMIHVEPLQRAFAWPDCSRTRRSSAASDFPQGARSG